MWVSYMAVKLKNCISFSRTSNSAASTHFSFEFRWPGIQYLFIVFEFYVRRKNTTYSTVRHIATILPRLIRRICLYYYYYYFRHCNALIQCNVSNCFVCPFFVFFFSLVSTKSNLNTNHIDMEQILSNFLTHGVSSYANWTTHTLYITSKFWQRLRAYVHLYMHFSCAHFVNSSKKFRFSATSAGIINAVAGIQWMRMCRKWNLLKQSIRDRRLNCKTCWVITPFA